MADVLVYGTQEEVAAMAKMYTRAGIWVDPVPAVPGPYDKGTNPSLTQVEQWLVNVSAQMNLALGNANFIVPFYDDATPLVKSNAYYAISQYVVSLVADMCHYVNSSGRFYSDKLVERGITPLQAILKDMIGWIALNERGLLGDGLLQHDIPVIRNQISFRTMGEFPRGGYRRRGS
jgi:hypothetical protein